MRPALSLVVGVVLAGLWSAALVYGSEPQYEFAILIPEPATDASKKDLLDAALSWGTYLKETGVGEFTGRLVDTVAELDAFVHAPDSERVPAFAVVDPLIGMAKLSSWSLTPLLCTEKDGSTSDRKLVLTLRSHPGVGVESLGQGRLAVVETWAGAPRLLGALLFPDGRDPEEYFSEIVAVETQADAVIAVLRRQADAAVVNTDFWDLARRRNRDVWRELKKVAELSETHRGLIVGLPTAPTEIIETIRRVGLTARQSDSGSHALDVFRADRLVSIDTPELQRVEGRIIARIAPSSPPKRSRFRWRSRRRGRLPPACSGSRSRETGRPET